MRKLKTLDIDKKQIEQCLCELDDSLEKGHYEILHGSTTKKSTTARLKNSTDTMSFLEDVKADWGEF